MNTNKAQLILSATGVGLISYLSIHFSGHHFPLYALATFSISLCLFWIFCLENNSPSFWLIAVLLSAIYAALQLTRPNEFHGFFLANDFLFYLSLFICLCLLQNWLKQPRQFDYPILFQDSWRNALALISATLLGLFCTVITVLFSQLISNFAPLSFIGKVIGSDLVLSLVFSSTAGLGLAIALEKINPSKLKALLYWPCYYLLPVTSALVLLTLISAIGKPQLLDFNAGALVILLSLFLINSVRQTDSNEHNYPRPIQWLVNLFIFSLPVLCFIPLRHSNNFYGFYFLSLLMLYCLSYAIDVLAARKHWLKHLGKINISLAFVCVLSSWIINSGLISWH